MKKKILLLFIAQIITNYAFTQNYENFEPDKIKIDSEESIVYQQFKNKYD